MSPVFEVAKISENKTELTIKDTEMLHQALEKLLGGAKGASSKETEIGKAYVTFYEGLLQKFNGKNYSNAFCQTVNRYNEMFREAAQGKLDVLQRELRLDSINPVKVTPGSNPSSIAQNMNSPGQLAKANVQNSGGGPDPLGLKGSLAERIAQSGA